MCISVYKCIVTVAFKTCRSVYVYNTVITTIAYIVHVQMIVK